MEMPADTQSAWNVRPARRREGRRRGSAAPDKTAFTAVDRAAVPVWATGKGKGLGPAGERLPP
jgi:hypothetical protein